MDRPTGGVANLWLQYLDNPGRIVGPGINLVIVAVIAWKLFRPEVRQALGHS